MSLVMSIDQSITNTAWNLFKNGELVAFGSFGSKAGTKKSEKGYIIFNETVKIISVEGVYNETYSTGKDFTDNFQRVGYSVKCFNNVIENLLIKYGRINHYIFENLAFGAQGDATRNLAGLLFSIVKDLDFGSYSLVAPTSAKKVFTGSGKALKIDMINALPRDVYKLYLDAGFKHTPMGVGDLNDLADSYSFYQWYLQQ